MKSILSGSKIGVQGIEDLEFIVSQTESLGLSKTHLDFDVTLARGLNYYTGAIFEVSAPASVKMGSIGGGGRYDDLTGVFGLKNMSGVGISFGLDRIYLVLEALNLFPKDLLENKRVLFLNFGQSEVTSAMQLVKVLRENHIAAELYPDKHKIGKQFTYADKNNYKYVALLGDNELENQTLVIKNMKSGEQTEISQADIVDYMSSKIK
jgi:histidyl-tRNA synthetase